MTFSCTSGNRLLSSSSPKPSKEELSRAVIIISNYLASGKGGGIAPIDLVNKSCQTAMIAVAHFEQYGQEAQEQLFSVKEHLMNRLEDVTYLEDLVESSTKKQLHNRLVECFIGGLYEKQVRAGPKSWVYVDETTEADDFVDVADESQAEPDPLTQAALAERKEQTALIADFGEMIMRDYYGRIIGSNTKKPKHALSLESHFTGMFKKQFISAIPHLFFRTPKTLSTHQKKIISCIMAELHAFFENYNNSEIYLEKIDSAFPQKNLGDRESLILTQMLKNLHQHEGPIFIPENLDNDEITVNLCEQVQHIIRMMMEPSEDASEKTAPEVLNFYSLMIAYSLVPTLFNRVTTPHLFCMIIDNLLLTDFEPALRETNEVPLKLCDASDKEFSNTLGDHIEKLGNDICILGKSSGLLNYLPMGIGKLKYQIGKTVQQGLNKLLNNECIIEPILLIKEALYKNGEPIILTAFEMDESMMKEYQATVKTKLQTRLYEVVRGQMPPIVRISVEAFTSFDQFCKTLSCKLFDISQSERLYKVMFCYILEGVRKGLLPDGDNT